MPRAIDSLSWGRTTTRLALVFPSEGICRRLPWDSSPPFFSAPSGRGRMLSRVEEKNEPILRSQLRPTELEHGHAEHTGGSSDAGVPEQGFGAERLVRDVCRGMQLSPPCLRSAARLNVILAALRTFAQELHPGPALGDTSVLPSLRQSQEPALPGTSSPAAWPEHPRLVTALLCPD